MKQFESEIFGSSKANFDSLLEFGFSFVGDVYRYECGIDSLRCIVEVDGSSQVDVKLFDGEEEYETFRVESSIGYALQMKEEVKSLLQAIKKACFPASGQRARIESSIQNLFGTMPIQKWEDETFLVYEHPGSKKWFCLFMEIPANKVGMPGKNPVQVVNIKLNPSDIVELIQKDGYFPAYHMNKKYWITLILEGQLKDEEVIQQISKSFEITKSKGD